MGVLLAVLGGLASASVLVLVGKVLERWMFPTPSAPAEESVCPAPDVVVVEVAPPPDPLPWCPIVSQDAPVEPVVVEVKITPPADERPETPMDTPPSEPQETPAERAARRAARKRARREAARSRAPKTRQKRVKPPKPPKPQRAVWRETGTDQYQHRDGAVMFWRDGYWEMWGGDRLGAIRGYSPKKLATYLGLGTSGLPDA